MPSRVSTRQAATVASPAVETDPDILGRYLEDAAHFPGGRTPGVVRPRSLDEVAACVKAHQYILPVGAQSSLTGGATPLGDVVLSTERLIGIEVRGDRVRAGAGVPLLALQEALDLHGRWFPPVPTYMGAFVGGAVATCAAGAATFKYGTVRPWVEGLTVVLAGGDVLEISRGQVTASAEGTFTIETSSGVRTVPLPRLAMPDVPKRSAGYFVQPGMDLVDLFVGSEGTLGVIVDTVLRTAPRPAGACRALVPMSGEPAAIALVDELRRASQATWASRDPAGLDVSAIEHVDGRSIEVLRQDGVDRRLDISIPATAGALLIIEIELPTAAEAPELWSQLESARESSAPDTPLTRLCRLLDRHGVLDDTELALPHERARAAKFAELREAVPSGVNRRVAQARHDIDPRIHKTAADMIVPFARFGELMATCRRLFAERSLDLAVWGHISDGNVHPNVIPHRAGDMEHAQEAILALGAEVIRMGGCPLAEHGVGRSAMKQALVGMLYGDEGVDAMRRVKLSLDPGGQFAVGVVFPGR